MSMTSKSEEIALSISKRDASTSFIGRPAYGLHTASCFVGARGLETTRVPTVVDTVLEPRAGPFLNRKNELLSLAAGCSTDRYFAELLWVTWEHVIPYRFPCESCRIPPSVPDTLGPRPILSPPINGRVRSRGLPY